MSQKSIDFIDQNDKKSFQPSHEERETHCKVVRNCSKITSEKVKGDKIVDVVRTREGSVSQRPLSERRGGRPALYKEEFCGIAKVAAKQGSTDKQIGELFGVNSTTIRYWQEQHHEFLLAIRDGRDSHNVRIAERALVRLATGFECDESSEEHTYIRSGKGRETEYIPARKVRTYHKVYAPNPTALIFLLINRSRKDGRWQDIQNVHLSGPNGEPIKAITSHMSVEDATAIYMDLLKRGAADFSSQSDSTGIRVAGGIGRKKRL